MFWGLSESTSLQNQYPTYPREYVFFFLSPRVSAFTPVKEQRSLWGRAREKGCQENSSTFNQDCSLENLTIPSFKEF